MLIRRAALRKARLTPSSTGVPPLVACFAPYAKGSSAAGCDKHAPMLAWGVRGRSCCYDPPARTPAYQGVRRSRAVAGAARDSRATLLRAQADAVCAPALPGRPAALSRALLQLRA